MKKLRVAVIGVGHLGKFHAQKYQNIPQTDLVAVCDADKTRCDTVSQELGVKAIYDFRELFNNVDAVSIVTPTLTHYPIAKMFLEAGVHVLLEKPMTETLNQADDLIQTALKNKLVLQVGHIERFNPAIIQLQSIITQPKLIESVRTGPFQPRNLDVSVVLDLMIHDIDILHSIHRVPIKSIEATGLAMMSDLYDVANARLIFEDGCIANLTVNRMAPKKERTIKVYQASSHIFVDCQEQTVSAHHKETQFQSASIEYSLSKADTLSDQIKAFIEAILLKQPPLVDGTAGKEALKIALAVMEAAEREKVPA